MILIAMLVQTAAGDAAAQCRLLARSDPAAAERRAGEFPLSGSAGGLACRGAALAQQARWNDAARAYTDAARRAEVATDPSAATFWVQAGNAWLAAGRADDARTALDTALAAGTLDDAGRGEAHLDRARALVAAGSLAPARADIDAALATVGEDPLAWLLSATLARRTGDLARARTDIAGALRLSADDASVQLEAGNIAALSNEPEKAQAAWREAARLAPDAPAGRSAAQALRQFAPEGE